MPSFRDLARRHGRRLLILPPLLVAAVILVLAVRGRPAPPPAPAAETARPARVITVQPLTVVPRVTGYGSVLPGRTWDMVAEVGGRVVEVHPDLKNGALIAAGTVLARIDPSASRHALTQVEAQLRENAVREANTRRSLDIERRALATLRRDLERKQALAARDAAARTAVDAAERAVLQGEQAVQSLETTLAVLPTERAALEARRADAERDLARTELVAPFALRVGTVAVERDQYAAKGAVLATADGLDTAEVTAQIPLARMAALLRGHSSAGEAAAPRDLTRVRDLTASVRLTSGDLAVSWPATVARVAEAIDPATRTVGVIVAVEAPYAQAVAGERPPLARGLHVAVDLTGAPRSGLIAVPRDAVRDGAVWVADAGNRLRRRAVSIAFRQEDAAVLADGLEPGTRVVVSDLIPAVEGMALVPVEDTAAAAAIVAAVGAAAVGKP